MPKASPKPVGTCSAGAGAACVGNAVGCVCCGFLLLASAAFLRPLKASAALSASASARSCAIGLAVFFVASRGALLVRVVLRVSSPLPLGGSCRWSAASAPAASKSAGCSCWPAASSAVAGSGAGGDSFSIGSSEDCCCAGPALARLISRFSAVAARSIADSPAALARSMASRPVASRRPCAARAGKKCALRTCCARAPPSKARPQKGHGSSSSRCRFRRPHANASACWLAVVSASRSASAAAAASRPRHSAASCSSMGPRPPSARRSSSIF